MPDSQGPPAAVDLALHRRLAVDLFNFVWTLLEKPQRSVEENDAMLNAACASCYHWGLVGQPVNQARGQWQISRVCSVLGLAESAAHHARRSLKICRQHNIGDFDLAFAYEALARAAAVAKNADRCRENLQLARDAANDIKEVDDREWLMKNLAEIQP